MGDCHSRTLPTAQTKINTDFAEPPNRKRRYPEFPSALTRRPDRHGAGVAERRRRAPARAGHTRTHGWLGTRARPPRSTRQAGGERPGARSATQTASGNWAAPRGESAGRGGRAGRREAPAEAPGPPPAGAPGRVRAVAPGTQAGPGGWTALASGERTLTHTSRTSCNTYLDAYHGLKCKT